MSDIAPATEQPAAETSAPTFPAKAWRGYVRKTVRSLAPARRSQGYSLPERALRLVLPWGFRDYPGIERGSEELFGGRAARETVICWRRGKRNMPAWAARMLGAYLGERGELLVRTSRELFAYADVAAARPLRGPGFRKVGADGRDGRPKTGRGKRKEV